MQVLCPVDHEPLAKWITDIPFEDWPQQHRLDDGKIRPAMVSDLKWHGFDQKAWPLLAKMHRHFPDMAFHQHMLSVVMPGHSIPPHIDEQPEHWLTRVHVPLTSNDESWFVIEDIEYQMAPGHAYLVNTRRQHAVTNNGATPRIHFMFDVRSF